MMVGELKRKSQSTAIKKPGKMGAEQFIYSKKLNLITLNNTCVPQN